MNASTETSQVLEDAATTRDEEFQIWILLPKLISGAVKWGFPLHFYLKRNKRVQTHRHVLGNSSTMAFGKERSVARLTELLCRPKAE